jgi:IS30 family transposase
MVRAGLARGWSPAQIAGRANLWNRRGHVSPQTIYTWIRQNQNRDLWEPLLPRRRNRRWPARNRAKNAERARIRNRPGVIERRMRLGDFEGDTVLGPPGRGGLATLVCRKSRFAIIVKILSKSAGHVHARLEHRLKELDSGRRRSITFDNGTEFALCHRLEKHFDITLYFADPGCPYQRGTNENTNGLIRQYFPKATDFRTISHQAVGRVERLLNNRPRACLGFRTPHEVFFKNSPPTGCD